MYTDRIVPGILFLMFSSGIILMLQFLPGEKRLKRKTLPLKEELRIKALVICGKVKNSTLYRQVREDQINRAICEDLSYLRNLIIAHKGLINSDAVISSLAERNGILRKTYIRMLSLMRTGRVQEAERLMQAETATEMGKEYASLLVTWEEIPPEQLEEIIVSYRRSIKEMSMTRQKKREELISDLIYLPATLNIFLIFINFVYISYFMEQKEMLDMMF